MASIPELPPLNIREVLRRHGLRPRKSLGQNFLVSSAALARVVDTAGVTGDDRVLEIGPGVGNLTRHLAVRAGEVIAVEKDRQMFPALQEVLAPFANVRLVHGDILELDPAELMAAPGYVVVANIPYYITSALMRHLLEARVRPDRLTLTVQREVADRICASPGEMSLLALSVQVYGDPEIVDRVPASAFFPRPKVDSSVIRVDLAPEAPLPPSQLEAFFRLARAGFSQRRKKLRNALAGGLAWPTDRVEALMHRAGVEPRRRAETLSVAEWMAMARAFEAETST